MNQEPVRPSERWLNAVEAGASGSAYQTRATTAAGENRIRVASPGDFQAGQGVMITRAFLRYENATLFSGSPGKPASRGALTDQTMEIRGYDGTQGSWLIYLLEISPDAPGCFRWSEDSGRTWKGPLEITHDWQPLAAGLEVRMNRRDWGNETHAIWFSARDLLISTILRIEGNTLIIADQPNYSSEEAVVMHCDDEALQRAIDRSLKEGVNLHIPKGIYRLGKGLAVAHAGGLTLEGVNGGETILDISQGSNPLLPWKAACLTLVGGKEVTLRNLMFVGNSGFSEADQRGGIQVGEIHIWGFYLKGSNALSILDTERVLVENCHARRMATECFYSQGAQEGFVDESQKAGSKSIVYRSCSVEDCARNAFNNNDLSENTVIENCRIKDVGGCTWEGASRFVRFVNNYICNAGTVAMGNVGFRHAHLENRGTGQHVIADNTFEGHNLYNGREGGVAIRSYGGASQIIIRNNTFVNYKGSGAIELSGQADQRHLPSGQTIVTGNIIDLTSPDEIRVPRTAILSDSSDAIISDNQIYVRGVMDSTVIAISLGEQGINVNVHDNLIRNCGRGIVTTRRGGTVAEVVDDRTFRQKPHVDNDGAVALERRKSHRYRNWNLVWKKEDGGTDLSVIESFDPETFCFRLKKPYAIAVNQSFEIYPPSANWLIHHNTVSGCGQPVRLDANGSPTSIFTDNIVSRDNAEGVSEALTLRGQFLVKNNHFHGFDE